MTPSPSAFISYAWEDDAHNDWVQELATRLRADGVEIILDRWSAAPGDQLPQFMETAIRDTAFTVVICTPRYKDRSDNRKGGVGYEGHIMTSEMMTQQNHRKFIPVHRSGNWSQAAPSWLAGKYYINLSDDPYSERDYADLVRTLLGVRQTAPPVGSPMATIKKTAEPDQELSSKIENTDFEDIRITRVIIEEITEPRNDGTRGSGLYAIPFALSRVPPAGWAKLFVATWDYPPTYSTMHRPGIAKISGSTVVLDGTTIGEVERHHRDTLQLVVQAVNETYRQQKKREDDQCARENANRERHKKDVDDTAKRIRFD
jgi:hypothetical protein